MNRAIVLILLIFNLLKTTEAHPDLVYPVKSETFQVGETITIEWRDAIVHQTIDYHLYYSLDDGDTWSIIAEDIPNDTYTMEWVIPEANTDVARIRILQDNVNQDYEFISVKFTISSTTEIKQQQDVLLNFFPNPTNGTTYIPHGFTDVVAYGPLGNQITLNTPGANSLVLPSKGIWWIRGKFEGQAVTRKILVY